MNPILLLAVSLKPGEKVTLLVHPVNACHGRLRACIPNSNTVEALVGLADGAYTIRNFCNSCDWILNTLGLGISNQAQA